MNEIPLVLVHGYPLDHTMWFSTIASLGAQARVICPDLPGFGREPTLNGEPNMDVYAQWLARMLESSGAKQVVVAGMSMGGYVALAFAEQFRDRLAGLGLISTQAAADTPETRAAREAMLGRIEAEGAGAAAQGILPKFFSRGAAPNPALVNYVEEGARKAGKAGLSWALRAMASRPDRTALVEELDVPVLILHGKEDQIVPVKKAEELASLCRYSLHQELAGAGHASPLEAPDQVAHALAKLMQAARWKVSDNPVR